MNHYQKMLSDGLAASETGNRLQYLSDEIFDFVTYDSEMAELFSKKAVEVCKAITERKTFEYIEDNQENLIWYLMMCNTPFFLERIEWGTSVRGAWWVGSTFQEVEYESDEWERFVEAIIEFANTNSNQDERE